MTSAIILAAGSSSRLGQPKQNILIANETLLERTIRVASLACLSPIFVVLSPVLAQGPGTSQFRDLTANGQGTAAATDANVKGLINHEAAEGMASSIRLGVRAAMEMAGAGAVILACDQIAVSSEHLRLLTVNRDEPTASSYDGRNGIPAYFPQSLFEDLLKLRGDSGAREILRHAASVPLIDGDLDIDTPEDLARVRLLYR